MEEQNPIDIQERVSQKIREGIQFDFDAFFKNAWEIFKKTFWMVAVSLILICIPLLIISVILGPILGTTQNQPDIQPGDNPTFKEIMDMIMEGQEKLTPIDYLKQSVMSFIILFIAAPLQAGWLYISRLADKDKVSFGDTFAFYKNALTGRVIVAGLITTTISVLTSFAFNFVPTVGWLINLLFAMIYYYLFLYVVPFIIYGNAPVGKAFSLSIKLFFAKPWPAIGFTLLFGLLACTGFLACCIGIIFTVAFVPACVYLLYKYSIGFPEDETPEEEQGHWQDQQPPTV